MSSDIESPAILVILSKNTQIPLIFSSLIGIPSAILYIMEMAIIVRKRKKKEFKSSFFKLFFVRAFSSLLGFVFAFLGQRFGRIGWFLPLYLELSRLTLASFYFLVTYSFHLENISTAVLLFNRLHSIVFPLKYEKFWQKRIPWIVCLTFLLPIPFTWHILLHDEYVHIQADNSTFTLDVHPRQQPLPIPTASDPEVRAWSSVIFTFVCLTTNLAVFFSYRLRNKSILGSSTELTQQQQNANKVARKLTIFTLFTFAAQLIYAIYMILIYITIKIANTQPSDFIQLMFLSIYNQLPWVNDCCTIVLPAWLILWSSNIMRKEISKSICCFIFRSKCQQQQPTNQQQQHHGAMHLAWTYSN